MTRVRYVERAPRDLRFQIGEDDPQLRAGDPETIAEIFRTPLTGAYTWNYEEADKRIRKLYRLGKGVPKDDMQAFKWFLKAADQKDPEAEKILAELKQN